MREDFQVVDDLNWHGHLVSTRDEDSTITLDFAETEKQDLA